MQKFISNISKKYKYLALFSVVLLVNCKEVFEKDLSDQSVNLIIPQNNTITPNRNVHFKWSEIEGATSYTLQIVSPSFSNIQYFDIDSSVESTEIFINLVPGNYEWKLRANNYSSRTDFSLPYKLTIDTSSDLQNHNIVLINPSANTATNSTSMSFSWATILEADNYDFILKKGNDWNSGIIFNSQYDLTVTNSSVTSLDEGEYIWGVRAKNSVPSLTLYSQRSLFVDTTSPPTLATILPAHNATIPDSTTFSFTWSVPSDIGIYKSNRTHIVEYSTDSTFATSDTLQSSTNSVSHVFNVSGNYFWRMYSIDDATNVSPTYSLINKLIIF